MHLSAGLFIDGKPNPYEDFYYDHEFTGLLEYFSQGIYGDGCEVELILNGDVLDFLNVSLDGKFPEQITEAMSIRKLQIIFDGHPEVVSAMQEFLSRPGKSIVYNVGNHDPDFFFPGVQKLFCETLAGPNASPNKVRVNVEKEYLEYPGVEIHHGNEYEAIHVMSYEKPIIETGVKEPILNIPWGTVFVLSIVNRLKRQRDYIDRVKPAKLMIFWGLLTDTFFMIKFLFISSVYFMKTRFIYSPSRRAPLRTTLRILKEGATPFHSMKGHAEDILSSKPDVHTVIFGHTHGALQHRYETGKTYINTGTWTRMVNLDLLHLGQSVRLTFALVEYDKKGNCVASLQEWMGVPAPHRMYNV